MSERYRLRTRTLTHKAMEQYTKDIEHYDKKLVKQWHIILGLMDGPEQGDEMSIGGVERAIKEEFQRYDSILEDYRQYLERTRTEESCKKLNELTEFDQTNRKIACDYVNILRSKCETGSVRSRNTLSLGSSRSRAKLNAAKAKAAYSRKEAELHRKKIELEEQEIISAAAANRKQADIDIELKLLEGQKELAVAEAEFDEELNYGYLKQDVNLENIPITDTNVKTANYVLNPSAAPFQPPAPQIEQTLPPLCPLPQMEQPLPPSRSLPQVKQPLPPSHPLPQVDQPLPPLHPLPQVEQPLPPFHSVPQRRQPLTQLYSVPKVAQTYTNDIAAFLMRKDILSSRLSVFNDRPECYLSWKSTFKKVCTEIVISSDEEIDLLIKWLGPVSKGQVISLKAAFSHNPNEGLRRIWDRLDERYGTAEGVYNSVIQKLESFPKLQPSPKDSMKLYDLVDILTEIEGLKSNKHYTLTLSYFDSSVGVNQIVNKLPFFIQERWTSEASKYKRNYGGTYPPFHFFTNFVREQCKARNDPSFFYDHQQYFRQSQGSKSNNNKTVKTNKTDLEKSSTGSNKENIETPCPIHKTNHSLHKCRAFLSKTHDEKRKFLRENELCFKCLISTDHIGKNCPQNIICEKCQRKHATAMHMESPPKPNGGEQPSTDKDLTTKCTDICRVNGTASCAKIVLLDIFTNVDPERKIRAYAILDNQSNCSLAAPQLFSLFGLHEKEKQYTLKSCSGSFITSGRHTDKCIIQSLDGNVRYKIPSLIECADIPCNKQEICSPEQARYFPHLQNIPLANIDENADILLLLGRDVTDAHHVLEQVTGPPGTPFAQRLSLGWVVIGELCLNTMHSQSTVSVNKINILSDGRPSLFKPCRNMRVIQQSIDEYPYDSVFVRGPDDNKVSMSFEDKAFLEIMGNEFRLDDSKHWVAPLPFRSPRKRLPNNFPLALKRAKIFDVSLGKNEVKKQHSIEFMKKIIDNGHAEKAPVLNPNDECWYLPLFGVYHPKKPDQIRLVFDSSAIYEGLSLNSVLLPGPDLINSLVGVLLRFRCDQVAIMADIEQMFYSFSVQEQHRNFLRFLWYEENDPGKPLVEYHMCKHVFGNSPSPAIATYGLHRSVEKSDYDVKNFVINDFYVDDGLTSLPSAEKAVNLLQRTQSDLGSHGLRLHKISSNCPEVMKAFPQDDLAKNLKDLDFDKGQLPQQRSLGVVWDLNADHFCFTLNMSGRPCTRRGILSIVNSIFDPLGFLAPVTIEGKLILREITSSKIGWDDDLPLELQQKWLSWLHSLEDLENIQVQRPYFLGENLSTMSKVELHVFSDASQKAISAVVYVVGLSDHHRYIGFVCGKGKVAPMSGHTIPRLELCAAVLAIQLYENVLEHLGINVTCSFFYSDSKVVLGYICNQSRRFYTYVSNRVHRIRQSSNPDQWRFVPSHLNPADIASRGISPKKLPESIWFTGPSFLFKQSSDPGLEFALIDPDQDAEIRPCISVNTTAVNKCLQKTCLGTERFERFSSWKRLVVALSILCHITRSFHVKDSCEGWHLCQRSRSVELKHYVESLIVREVQKEVYSEEFSCLKQGKPVCKASPLIRLDPFLDENGILHVGGRLARSDLTDKEKYPVILPGKHHISKLLVRYFHASVKHQGRHFTEGVLRARGYWITGSKRLVSSVIQSCVFCKKVRGKFESQKMSDLPEDRVMQAKPFSYVGVDVFGPWPIVTRRTRGGHASSKRWAVLFTCLTIRAVHLEVIEDMSSSSFINALRRFTAIRGKVKQYRSDRGTNFVGATDDLGIQAINVEDSNTRKYLYDSDSVWIFNAPHSSHMGGSWERMIGLARRILDSMFLEFKSLTHDVLITVMAEEGAIINSRPIVSVSNDGTNPEILSPSSLLTMKFVSDQQPIADLDMKGLYKKQWEQVNYLANRFWLRWRKEYLHSLQQRRKWTCDQSNVQVGDVVLMNDKTVGRCFWPMARVQRVFQSEDGKVRKVEVIVVRDGKKTTYIRPVVELVKLV